MRPVALVRIADGETGGSAGWMIEDYRHVRRREQAPDLCQRQRTTNNAHKQIFNANYRVAQGGRVVCRFREEGPPRDASRPQGVLVEGGHEGPKWDRDVRETQWVRSYGLYCCDDDDNDDDDDKDDNDDNDDDDEDDDNDNDDDDDDNDDDDNDDDDNNDNDDDDLGILP